MRVGTIVPSKFFVDPALMPTLFRVFGLRTMLFVEPSWLASDPCAKANLNPIRRLLCGPEIPAFEGRRGGPCVHHGGKPITAMIELVSLATTAGSFGGRISRGNRETRASIRGNAARWTWASKRTICVDFGISRRWSERLSGRDPDLFQTRLAAFRWPEEVLVDDLGTKLSPVRPMRAVFP